MISNYNIIADSKKETVLSTKNRKIVEFYNSHKYLDFEQVNLLCVDLFENILSDASNSLNKTISSQILHECTDSKNKLNDYIQENRNKFNEINNQFLTLHTNMVKMNSDLILRMVDNKKDYIDDIKTIINNYSNDKNEKISSIIEKLNTSFTDKTTITFNNLLEKSTVNFVDKTKLAIAEIIPNNFDKITNNIEHDFQKFSLSISQDLQKIISNEKGYDKQLLDLIQKTQESLSRDVIPNNMDKMYNSINRDFINFSNSVTQEIQRIMENNKDHEKELGELLQKISENEMKLEENSSKTQEKEKILDELKIFLQRNKESQIDIFVKEFENKFNLLNQSLQQSVQQPILYNLDSSEQRINSKLNGTEEKINSNIYAMSQKFTDYDRVFKDLKEYLDKYRNPSIKGNICENRLRLLLNHIYPSAEIIDTSHTKGSGDSVLKRKDRDDILLETKEYEANVNSDEVKKFIKDCSGKKMHGILLSQISGIAGKSNFEIEINDGKILIYIHNAEYHQDKIISAVDIIDILSTKINEINNPDNDIISHELVAKINEEYNTFQKKKR